MIIIAVAGTFQNSRVKDYSVLCISQAANGGGAEKPESRDNESGRSPYQRGPRTRWAHPVGIAEG